MRMERYRRMQRQQRFERKQNKKNQRDLLFPKQRSAKDQKANNRSFDIGFGGSITQWIQQLMTGEGMNGERADIDAAKQRKANNAGNAMHQHSNRNNERSKFRRKTSFRRSHRFQQPTTMKTKGMRWIIISLLLSQLMFTAKGSQSPSRLLPSADHHDEHKSTEIELNHNEILESITFSAFDHRFDLKLNAMKHQLIPLKCQLIF